MSEAASLEPRVVAVETKLDVVIKAIGDLTTSVKDIASRPSNIAWREIAMTAGAFLALFAYFDRYVENKTTAALAMHDTARTGDAAVVAYRLDQIERQVRLIAPIAGAIVLGKKEQQ